MSFVFQDNAYRKPFATTYLNTATFTLYLVKVALSNQWPPYKDDYQRHENLHDEETIAGDAESISLEITSSDSDFADSHRIDHAAEHHPVANPKLSLRSTMKLSFQFCLLWFAANYMVNAALVLTTVASSTVLSSTSSLWTLIIGIIAGVEIFSFSRLLSVLSTLGGVLVVVLASISDEKRDDRDLMVGNVLALFSAVFYGAYITLLKKRIGDENNVNMYLFLGLVGAFNIVLLWPFFFVLHAMGMETFELPPNSTIVACLVANAILGSFLSEILWLKSMLLTTPLISTIGISLTIPFAVAGDIVAKHQHYPLQFFLGVFMIIIGFLTVNLAGVYTAADRKFDNIIWNRINTLFRRQDATLIY